MTAWTTPRTWTIGETVTKSIMDTHVRDNLNYLYEQIPYTILQVQNSIPPLSGITAAALQLIESSGAGTAKPVLYELLFDSATTEGRMWVFRATETIGTVTLNIGYHMKSANVSKAVVLSAQLAAISSGDASSTAKVFASANTATVTVPDAAGTRGEATITMTNADSVAKGDWVCLYLQRTGGNAGDTASGDMAVTDVEFIYA